MQISPGIFQKKIIKKYELRVNCFGDYIVSVKLNIDTLHKEEIDWRVISPKKITLEPYLLPDEIQDKLRAFMKKIGIVFGVFDIIVTPDDEYIFIEVLEQGQFLWIEESNNEFKMLDIFIKFIVNKLFDFLYATAYAEHTLDRYRTEVQFEVEHNKRTHLKVK